MSKRAKNWPLVAASATAGALCMATALTAQASSHREAPFTSANPTIDGTDFYMFRSYGSEPANTVTFIANYVPLQAPGGGPNYYPLNENAVYDINVDNNGNARPNVRFRFNFTNHIKGQAVPSGNQKTPIPLIISGSVGTSGNNASNAAVNRYETYTVTMYQNGRSTRLKNPSGGTTFMKPLDNIGNKSISNYSAYAQNFMYSNVSFGNCGSGKIFVGQRHEGFFINLGEIFDLFNTNPLGARNRAVNTLAGNNVTSIAVQAPAKCLTADGKSVAATADPVIGGWTTSSLPTKRVLANGSLASDRDHNGRNSRHNSHYGRGKKHRGNARFSQVSRLANPLVNELVIGLPAKDRFNASQPRNDSQFAGFVTNPSLPALISTLFPSVEQPTPPRNDLVAAFLTGLTLQTSGGATVFSNAFTANADHGKIVAAEMAHLNIKPAPKPRSAQNDLGLLACDTTGFPNGRRPGDDVTDIDLTVAEGAITSNNPNNLQTCNVSSGTPKVINSGAVVNDGAQILPTNSNYYIGRFPYLADPIPGSPNTGATGTSASQGQNQGGN